MDTNPHQPDPQPTPPEPTPDQPVIGSLLVAHGTQTRVVSGPIPDPQALREYEAIEPGFANRLLTMAENNAALRIRSQEKVIDAAIASEKGGRNYAFIIAMAFLASSTWIITHGHGWEGVALGGIDIVALVYVFIHGKRPPPAAPETTLPKKQGE